MESYYLCIKSKVHEKDIGNNIGRGCNINRRRMRGSGRAGSTTKKPTTNSTVSIYWIPEKKDILIKFFLDEVVQAKCPNPQAQCNNSILEGINT